MTEHKIACNSGVGDTLTVHGGGEEIGFVAATSDRFRNSVYVTASDARTFARGILALADEIDGGEAKEPTTDTRPKVGDRLRVTVDTPRCAPVKAGDVITVIDVDYDDPGAVEDFVRFLADGDGPGDYQWYVPLSATEPVTERSATTVKVGDRVRVVKDDPHTRAGEFVGAVGRLQRLHGASSTLPYRVEFDDDQGVPYSTWSVAEVEPAGAPGEPAATSTPSRAALLEQARQLLDDSATFGADDLIKLADYLAGESA